MDKPLITPKTKIAEILDAYPELEEVLIASAPQFKKLKNPVLRKTVAKITSIGQAAAIGGLKTEDLVNRLRKAVGQENLESYEDSRNKYQTRKPDWFSQSDVSGRIDIRDMLHAGEQPVYEALSRLRQLKEKEILEIIAPFVPAPLIDKSNSLGYKHWLQKLSDDEFRVYFTK